MQADGNRLTTDFRQEIREDCESASLAVSLGFFFVVFIARLSRVVDLSRLGRPITDHRTERYLSFIYLFVLEQSPLTNNEVCPGKIWVPRPTEKTRLFCRRSPRKGSARSSYLSAAKHRAK